LPATGFYKAGNVYGARFGSLTFGSRFHPITTRSGADDTLSGFYSELLIRSVTGKILSIDDVFQSLESSEQIVHLDRLTRTLHSLNYLQQYDNRDLLALAVQPGHITGVSGDHGKTFEGILSDCGLGPDRVLLHTRLLDEASLTHFRQALSNYRSRGYRIGITIEKQEDAGLLEQLNLEPDAIFYRLSEALSSANPRNAFTSDAALAKRILVTDTQTLNTISGAVFDGVVSLNPPVESPESARKVSQG